jgi:PAS domain S-box-containing protein
MATTDAHDLIQTSLLGEAVENAAIGVYVADENMRYLAVNRAASAMLGYERDELLGLLATSLSPLPDANERYREMVLAGERSGTTRALRKDGTEIEVEYWSCTTRLAQMTVYVTFVRALP